MEKNHMPVIRRINRDFPTPYWSLPEARIYLGDVRKVLSILPSRSVHCIVTSPPYWDLRDYGICMCNINQSKGCKLCGYTGRIISREEQIGTESSPDCGTWGKRQCNQCFVCNMVNTFSELKRVLRDDGVLWLNLGDTYTSSSLLPDGNLIGIPWRVALSLQSNGWVLRQDVIWSKSNTMPESVTNRCSKSHEYIFMLTKSSNYYFDMISIARTGLTPATTKTGVNNSSYKQTFSLTGKVPTGGNGVLGKVWRTGETGNKRSVWTVSTNSSAETHFAAFSKELIIPCILSSTSEYGCCVTCESPYERIVSKDDITLTRETVGWRKTCGCNTEEAKPCIVLDPFVGSGTTVVAAVNEGRHGIGIDVSKAYLDEHAIPRVKACIIGGSVKRRVTSPIPSRGTPPDMEPVKGI